MTPTDKAAARINLDFVRLNSRLREAASMIGSRASMCIDAALVSVGRQALADARAANKLARATIAALS